MFGQFSLTKGILGAVVVLAMTAGPALAAGHGGHGGHAGGHSGGGYHGGGAAHGGGFHSGGAHVGGYRGGAAHVGGYHGGRFYGGGGYRGYRGYNGGYWPGYSGFGLGTYYDNDVYPYYNDYSPPVVDYSSPTYDVTPSYTAGYYTPAPSDDTARVDVIVPSPDAQVLVDGSPTQQTGTDRSFVSPPLTPGQTFHYTFEARWEEGGRMVDRLRTVTVTAGQAATVDFTR